MTNTRDQITAAMTALGYIVNDASLVIEHISCDNYRVEYDGDYIGIWSTTRKTFVD